MNWENSCDFPLAWYVFCGVYFMKEVCQAMFDDVITVPVCYHWCPIKTITFFWLEGSHDLFDVITREEICVRYFFVWMTQKTSSNNKPATTTKNNSQQSTTKKGAQHESLVKLL